MEDIRLPPEDVEPLTRPGPPSRQQGPAASGASTDWSTIAFLVLVALVAGLSGGLFGAWIGVRRVNARLAGAERRLTDYWTENAKARERHETLRRQVDALGRTLQQAGRAGAAATAPLDFRKGEQPQPPPFGHDDRVAMEPPSAFGSEAQTLGGPPGSFAQDGAPPPAPPAFDLTSAIDGYRKLEAYPSREEFHRYFAALGQPVTVEPAPGNQAVQPAQGDRAYLCLVSRDRSALLFPNFDFSANAATHFTMIASVPDAVSAFFNLERGSGEIGLERPALFAHEGDRWTLKQRGTLAGFVN